MVEEGQGMGAIFLPDLVHVVGDLVQGLVPGDTGPLALAAGADPFHGILDPVRVVEELDPGVATGADPAAVDRAPGVALDLD